MGIPAQTGEYLISLARELVRADYWTELESITSLLKVSITDTALCNCYYDALKVVLGCTAFSVDNAGTVYHARNLDWWTESAILSRYTAICRFVGGSAGEFTTIGWPGFIGAFSGIAPGRFAVTLNAVLSLEPAVPSMPVVFALRTVLEEAKTFEDAFSILRTAPLPSDSLLLLTGARKGEQVVIERTPSRAAVRRGHAGFTCVTNDYRQVEANGSQAGSEILTTSCKRFDRIDELLSQELPKTPEDCFRYLNDPAVKMQITVQQMVFQPSTGKYWLNIPKVN